MIKTLISILIISTIKTELPSNGSIPLKIESSFPIKPPQKNIHNRHYFTIPLQIGTPPKTYNLQLDTSTITSWVPSIRCFNCQFSTSKYNDKESKTSSPTNIKVEINDEDGEVEGYKTYDNVILNDFNLRQFGFIQVYEIDDEYRDTYNGKLGLGFCGDIGHDFNFIKKLNFDRLISKRIFSIEIVNETFGMFFIGDLTVKKYTFCNCTTNEDLDDYYKQSWLCDLSHVGLFYDKNLNDINKLNKYNVLNKDRVEFDSAYDFIAIPKSDKDFIYDAFEKIGLKCYNNSNDDKEGNKKYNFPKMFEDEVSIFCEKKNINDNVTLSFVLQGFGYKIQLNKLFYDSTTYKNIMECLIKIIDDDDAIWTLGYPFFSNYLMIFNMEDKHVGIYYNNNKIKKIVDLESDWNDWYEKGGKNSLFSGANKTFLMTSTFILCALIFMIIICFIHRIISRRNLEKNSISMIIEKDNNAVRERIY